MPMDIWNLIQPGLLPILTALGGAGAGWVQARYQTDAVRRTLESATQVLAFVEGWQKTADSAGLADEESKTQAAQLAATVLKEVSIAVSSRGLLPHPPASRLVRLLVVSSTRRSAWIAQGCFYLLGVLSVASTIGMARMQGGPGLEHFEIFAVLLAMTVAARFIAMRLDR